jgi:hypothetical protein
MRLGLRSGLLPEKQREHQQRQGDGSDKECERTA